MINDDNLARIRALNEIAQSRGQTLAQLALAWVLRRSTMTSTLIGASSVQQLEDNVAAAAKLDFSDDELAAIDAHAVESGVDLWAGARDSTASEPTSGRSDRDVRSPAGGRCGAVAGVR